MLPTPYRRTLSSTVIVLVSLLVIAAPAAAASPSVTAQGGTASPGGTVTVSVTLENARTAKIGGIPTSWSVASKTTDGAIFNNGLKDGNPYVGWAWGSDQSSATVSVTFNLPSDASSQTLDVKVENNAGTTATTTAKVTIGSTNSPPSADFSWTPDTPTTGESISFDAGASSDSDGSISEYRWDFDNDGVTDAYGTSPSHTYSSSGDYSVSLTVVDGDGATDTVTQTVSVESSSPTSGYIRGEVTDTGGNAISGATVEITESSTGDVVATIQTESDGTFGPLKVAGGNDYTVSVSASGYTSFSTVVNVDAGETEEVYVTLEQSTTTGEITGDVVDTNYNPVPSEHTDDTYVELRVKHPDTGNWVDAYEFGAYHPSDADNRVSLDSSSHYSITNVETGYTYKLTVTSPTASMSISGYTIVRDKQSGTSTADIVIQPTVDEIWGGGSGNGTASFTYTPHQPQPGETITFTAAAAGPDIEYKWNFNSDPSIEASGREVQHTYDYAGVVNVTLMLVGDNGPVDSTSKTIEIQSTQSGGGGSDDGDGSGTGAVSVTVNGGRATPGDTAKVTFTIENTGSTDISTLGFNMTNVPDAVTVVSTSSDGSGSGDNLAWFWYYGLPAGTTHSVTLQVKVPQHADSGQVYTLEGRTVTLNTEITKTAKVRVAQHDASRFAGDDGKVGFTDVLNAIRAFNEDTSIGGQDVTFTDVLNAIRAYNTG